MRTRTLRMALAVVPALSLALAVGLMVGPGAGVAQARTVKYPDVDVLILKTSGGELKSSSVTWKNTTVYTRNYGTSDTSNEGRCPGVYESRVYADGKIEGPYFVTGTCDNQTNRLVMDVTAPKPLKSILVFICLRTKTNEPAECVTQMVYAGVD
ncbi:MAG TPA: hypothetical protein VIQ30_16060 [Pseudonocardia sp.]